MARKKSSKRRVAKSNVVEFGAPKGKAAAPDPEAARELLAEAFDARSERQAKRLVNKALALDPANVDARVMLADFEDDVEKRIALLEDAVASGRRVVESIDAPPGMLSLDMEARPFLRALYSLGTAFLVGARAADCLSTFEELLRLDERDGMGVRYELVALYLIADRLEDAKRLETRFAEDESAALSWARVLIYYRLRDFRTARKHLECAREANPYVEDGLGEPPFLSELSSDSEEDFHTAGEESEAEWILARQGMAWMFNPHVVGWLSGELDPDHADYVGPLNSLGNVADELYDDDLDDVL